MAFRFIKFENNDTGTDYWIKVLLQKTKIQGFVQKV